MNINCNSKENYSWILKNDIYDRLNAEFYSEKNITMENILRDTKYNKYKLKEICSKITQGPNPTYTTVCTEYLCLKTKDLSDYEINSNDCSYVQRNEFNSNKNYILEQGDILVGIKGEGSIGKSNIFLYEGNFIFTREVGLIRIKSDTVNKFYVSAFLRSKYGKGLLERGISGSSGQMTLTTEYIKNINIVVPDKKIQDYIGNKILKSNELKNKADILNAKTVNLLNEALSLDDYKADLKEYKNKFNWVRKVDINDRIDSTYYDPKLLILMKKFQNYNMVRLKNLVNYKKGNAFKSNDMVSGPNHLENKIFKVSDLNNYWIDYDNLVGIDNNVAIKYDDYSLENEDIVLSMTGTIGKSTVIQEKSYNLLLNQNAVRLRKNNSGSKMYYIDMILKSIYFESLINKSIFQSVQPFISMEFLNEVEIPLLSQKYMEEISDLYKASLTNLYNSRKLVKEAIRDVEDLIEENFDVSKIIENN